MIVVYGLKSCDTCRKALRWLRENALEARFHDLRADGLDEARLAGWLAELGWETLLNRRSTTWRGLARADKEPLDAARAEALMLAHPSLIKRPVLDLGTARLVGFTDAVRGRLAERR